MAENDTEMQLCTFEVCGRLFGVDILDVREICAQHRITPIHHAPVAVKGYMGLRGQIHLVVDLGTLFGFSSTYKKDSGKVVIFKPNVGEAFGILVDRVSDVVTVQTNQIEDRRKGETTSETTKSNERRRSASGLSSGVCKLEKGLMVILAPSNLLPHLNAPTGLTIPTQTKTFN